MESLTSNFISSGLPSRILNPQSCTELSAGHWRLFVLVSSFFVFFLAICVLD